MGLKGAYVNRIVIDRQGIAWIGTSTGLSDALASFDGLKWTDYAIANSGLPTDAISSVAIDQKGNKWIGTFPLGYTSTGALVKFDGRNWTVYDTSNSGIPINEGINNIAIDAKNNIWAASEPYWINGPQVGGGLIRFDGTQWIVYNTSNSGIPSNWVSSIAIDGDGNEWIGTGWNGFAKFDGTNWTVYDTSNSPLPGNSVFAIALDQAGNKWIATDKGLAQLDGVDWTIYSESNSGLPYDNVTAVAVDSQGNKWIGTQNGLAKFNGTSWTTYTTLNSAMTGNYVYAISADAEGNEWIATATGHGGGNGLLKFDGKNWRLINADAIGLFGDFNEDNISSISVDAHNDKWIGINGGFGSGGGGLWVYNENGIASGIKQQREIVPSTLALEQNYPNPFNPSTTISYDLPMNGLVTLKVYDVLGREVKTLVNERQSVGSHSVAFNASNLPSGVYFYRLQAGTYHDTKKLLLLK